MGAAGAEGLVFEVLVDTLEPLDLRGPFDFPVFICVVLVEAIGHVVSASRGIDAAGTLDDPPRSTTGLPEGLFRLALVVLPPVSRNMRALNTKI